MKRKILSLFISAVLFLSPAASHAAGLFGGRVKSASNSGKAYTLLKANNEVSLSYAYNARYYTERIGDNESGHVAGIILGLNSLSPIFNVQNVYEHIGFSNTAGNLNYTDGADGVNTTDNSNLITVNARLGKGFFLNSSAMLIPYIGYSYSKWDRNIGNGYVIGVSYSGYQEIYSYSALNLGVIGEYAPLNNLVVKARLQYGRMLGAGLNAYNVSGYPAMTFNLGNRPVYTAGIGLDYDIIGNLHGLIGIKYQRAFFGQSNPNSVGLYEPSSSTFDMVYTAGLAYSF